MMNKLQKFSVSASGYILFSLLLCQIYRISNFNELMYCIWGGGILSSQSNLFLIIFSLFPTVLILFIFGEDWETDLNILSLYVFTRTKRREKFIGKRIIKTALEIACTYIISLLILVLVSVLYAIDLSKIRFMFLVLVMSGSYLLTLVTVLLQNVLSLKIQATTSFLLVACCYCLSSLSFILTGPNISKVFAHVLPFIQGIYSLYDEKILEFPHFANNAVPGFTAEYSFLFLLVCLGAEYGISVWLIKKMDFLGGTNG